MCVYVCVWHTHMCACVYFYFKKSYYPCFGSRFYHPLSLSIFPHNPFQKLNKHISFFEIAIIIRIFFLLSSQNILLYNLYALVLTLPSRTTCNKKYNPSFPGQHFKYVVTAYRSPWVSIFGFNQPQVFRHLSWFSGPTIIIALLWINFSLPFSPELDTKFQGRWESSPPLWVGFWMYWCSQWGVHFWKFWLIADPSPGLAVTPACYLALMVSTKACHPF